MASLPPLLPPDPDAPFPPARTALRNPDGLLAIGGDLSPARLLNAYRHGIFPWFSEGQPILWWCPNPRTVFGTDGVRLSSKFRRGLRKSDWIVRSDTAFAQVIRACADTPRPGQRGTWIIDEMIAAYCELHRLGHAHSIEVFAPGATPGAAPVLVGGLYGVAIGWMFFAESMFSGESGGSKVALAALAHHLRGRGWPLIDAQVENEHLLSLGAQLWPRERFLTEIETLTAQPEPAEPWAARFGDLKACELAWSAL